MKKHTTKKLFFIIFAVLIAATAGTMLSACDNNRYRTPHSFAINETNGTITWLTTEHTFSEVLIRRAGETDFTFIKETADNSVDISILGLTVGENILRIISHCTSSLNTNTPVQSHTGNFTINITGTASEALTAVQNFSEANEIFSWVLNPLAKGSRVYVRHINDTNFTFKQEIGANFIARAELNLQYGQNTIRIIASGGQTIRNGVLVTMQNSAPGDFIRTIQPPTQPVRLLRTPSIEIVEDIITISNRDPFCSEIRLYFSEGLSPATAVWQEMLQGDYNTISIIDDINMPFGTGWFRVLSVGGRDVVENDILTRLENSTFNFLEINIGVTLQTPDSFGVERNVFISWNSDALCELVSVYIRRAGETDFEYVLTHEGASVRIDQLNLSVGENELKVISRGRGFARDRITNDLVFISDSIAGEYTIIVNGLREQRVATPWDFDFNPRGYEVIWLEDTFANFPRIYIRRAGENIFVDTGEFFPGEVDVVFLNLAIGTNTLRVISTGGQIALIDGYLVTFTDSLEADWDIVVDEIMENKLSNPYNFRITSMQTGVLWSHAPGGEESIVYIRRAGETEFERFWSVDHEGKPVNPLNLLPFSMLNLSSGQHLIRVASGGGEHTFISGVLTISVPSEFVYFIIEVDLAGNIVSVREVE